jgi:hypothetical protein
MFTSGCSSLYSLSLDVHAVTVRVVLDIRQFFLFLFLFFALPPFNIGEQNP